MSNVITDAMNIATENQHKIDNLYGVLNNYKLAKKNKGYENDHSNKSLKDIRRLLTSDKSDAIEFTTAPMKSAKSWRAICYGDGKFVAVSAWNSNIAAYSNDGITWLESTLPASKYWIDVCYGDGKFVAIAGNDETDYSAISYDGITWQENILPESNYWNSICYGDGRFVIVGSTNKVLYGDGIDYSVSEMPSDQDYMSVCYGNGKFVAVVSCTYRTGYFAYSTEGSSWSLVSTAAYRQSWYDVCYGGSKFMAVAIGVGSGGCNIYAYSYDGIVWTESELPIKAGCRYYGIDYGKVNGTDMFIVTESNGDGNGAFHYSYYGFEWESGVLPSASSEFIEYPICYGNGKFVIAPENSSVALYSEVVTDANMFEVADITSDARPTDLVFGAKTPVVYKEELGDLEGTTYNTISGSTTSTAVFAACYGNGTIIVIPQSMTRSTMNKVYYSTNEGTTWTQKTLPTYQKWRFVCYGNGKFVAVAYNSTYCVYSSDGITWTQGTLPVDKYWYSVCYGKDKFVAVAFDTDAFAYSSDGITWTQGTLPVNKYWYSVCYGKDKFVAVSGSSNLFAYSSDGITWTQGTLPVNKYWYSVCYGKDKFVAVAFDTDAFAYSSDGITWTQGNLPATNKWRSVCYGNDKFVVIHPLGFAYSSDGITWVYGKKTYDSTESYNFEHSGVVISTGSGFMLFGISDSKIQYWKVDKVEKPLGFNEINLPLADYKDYQAICFGNNQFVTQNYSSKILYYSSDGITWTSGSAVNYSWYSVCYGNGKYVAISNVGSGNNNTTMYSTDGITWTMGSIAYTSSGLGHHSIYYCNDKFFALATNTDNEYTYSTDGITWAAGQLNSKMYQSNIAFGNNIYVIIGKLGKDDGYKTVSEYSEDGINWSMGHLSFGGSDTSSRGLAFGNGVFVLPSGIANSYAIKYYYSHDGINWYENELPKWYSCDAFAFGGNKFVLLQSSNRYFYSLDGINWRNEPLDHSNTHGEICYGNGTFVLTPYYSNKPGYYSYELTPYNNYAYQESALPADIGLSRNIEYNKGGFNICEYSALTYSLCYGDDFYGNKVFLATSQARAYYSTDGNVWSSINFDIDFDYTGALTQNNITYSCYGNNLFVICDDYGNYAYGKPSQSGSGWSFGSIINPNDWQCYGLCYGNGKFVLLLGGQERSEVWYSSDGNNWNYSNIDLADFDTGCIGYGNGKFVMTISYEVSEKSLCYYLYSTDGITWEISYQRDGDAWGHISYCNDRFIAICSGTKYEYSTDGVTWTSANFPISNTWLSVCYAENRYIVVGYNNAFLYSFDGLNWYVDNDTFPSVNYAVWRAIYYGNDKFVIGGGNGSDDSVNVLYGTFRDSTSSSPTYTLVSTDLSIKDVLNSYGSSTGNYLASTTSIETIDSIDYLNSINVYTIDPATYETSKVPSWDLCKIIAEDNIRPTISNYEKIYAMKPLKNSMHKFYGWVYLNTQGLIEAIVTKDFINYYEVILVNYKFEELTSITTNTDVSNITDEQITKIVQKYLSILPDNTIVFMPAASLYSGNTTKMCYIIDPFSNTQEVKSVNNRTTFMSIKDDYGTGDYQNKAIAGMSAYLNDNGEIVVHYNNRSEIPLTIYNGRVMNTTPYSTKYTNYNKEVIASPKIAKLFGSATVDSTNNMSTFKTTIDNMSMDLAITTVDGKDNTSSASESYLPAASVSLAIGDVSDRIYDNEDERFKHFNKVALFVNEAIENMDNIDIDFSEYMETTAIDRDSVVKDGNNDKEYKEIDAIQGNLPSSKDWFRICYGKDKFVTVVYGSKIFAYSSDGITWTQGNLPSSKDWYSVCYGKDKFVTVAYSTDIFAYSSDGITWTQGNLPSSRQWASVCYGKDKFVTVEYGSKIFAYSSNGITWTQGNLPSSKYWRSVCYGNDKFVAVLQNDKIFVYSSDGITWTQGNLPSSKDWFCICYGKDKFVTVAYSTDIFAYSSDGITWTQGNLPSSKDWFSVCYGKDKFVTVAYSTDIFAYSSDGITWTQGNLPSSKDWRSVCYGKDKFVTVAYSTDIFAYIPDGDPMFISSKIYNSNTLEINNRSENTNSNLRYRATVIGNTLLSDKFHMNNPRFTK